MPVIEQDNGSRTGAGSSALVTRARNLHSTRLNLGSYFADIVSDGDEASPVIHWIVQRVGSSDVMSIGQEPTFARALEQAHDRLKELAQRSRAGKSPGMVFSQLGTVNTLR